MHQKQHPQKGTKVRIGFTKGGGTQIEIVDKTIAELKELIIKNTVERGKTKTL